MRRAPQASNGPNHLSAALQATGRKPPATGSFDLSEVLAAVDEIEAVMAREGGTASR